jgi:hypothetical protein
VGFLTGDEARGHGFTTIGICSLSIPCDAGIEMVRISTLNFLFWPPTWGINTFPELNDIFISPPKSFPRSSHE